MRARHSRNPGQVGADRTLLRGLALLRAFRPGFSVLTNGELAERCGLAPSTVSRMTGALVEAGFLRQLPGLGGYAPAAGCISLGFAAFQSLMPPRQRVLARMEEAAGQLDVSVSLATPDVEDMIYVDTFRRARRETLMHIAPGVRIPMSHTALGMATLALMTPAAREARIEMLLARHPGDRHALREQMDAGISHHLDHGWCRASWVADVVGVARAVQLPGYPILSFNCAGSLAQITNAKIERNLVPLLFELTALASADEGQR